MEILAALAPGDENLKLRNKLYAALERIMIMAENGEAHVPGAIIVRYNEAVKSSKGGQRTECIVEHGERVGSKYNMCKMLLLGAPRPREYEIC